MERDGVTPVEAAKARLIRLGVGRVGDHLESHYGLSVTAVSELDIGVLRVDRADGPSWVARLFPAACPVSAVAGDADLLQFLAAHDFPAERCASPDPVTELDGQGVLVTEYVGTVARTERQAAIRSAGGLRRLGELLGILHTLPTGAGPGALRRPGGGWHHLVDGGPGDERAAALAMLVEIEGALPAGGRRDYASLRAHVEAVDGCTGLPQALTHPDFVLANVLAPPGGGMVVVDWAGAGRGPRLWTLAFLLLAEGAKDLARVDRVVDGYRRHVRLQPDELSRLAAVVPARSAVLEAWSFCLGRKDLAAAARQADDASALVGPIAARARAAFERSGAGGGGGLG